MLSPKHLRRNPNLEFHSSGRRVSISLFILKLTFNMPIPQQQPRESEAPVQITADSLEGPPGLEYPHAPPQVSNTFITIILWSLGLSLGLLMLLARMPINAPEFGQLNQYACDPLPFLQGRRSALSAQTVVLTCRSGDKVVFQRGLPAYCNNPTWTSCLRAGGLIRIWRVANPSPYGSYVFHATCDDHVITYYRARVATYDKKKPTDLSLDSLARLSY
jgi:hypothetical protein